MGVFALPSRANVDQAHTVAARIHMDRLFRQPVFVSFDPSFGDLPGDGEVLMLV